MLIDNQPVVCLEYSCAGYAIVGAVQISQPYAYIVRNPFPCGTPDMDAAGVDRAVVDRSVVYAPTHAYEGADEPAETLVGRDKQDVVFLPAPACQVNKVSVGIDQHTVIARACLFLVHNMAERALLVRAGLLALLHGVLVAVAAAIMECFR